MKPVLAMSSPPYDGAFLHLQVVRRLAQWFFLVLKGIYNFALPLTSTPFSKRSILCTYVIVFIAWQGAVIVSIPQIAIWMPDACSVVAGAFDWP